MLQLLIAHYTVLAGPVQIAQLNLVLHNYAT